METLEFQQLKREALIRRSEKLMGWLKRPDYAVYVDAESTEQLSKLVGLVIWALEMSLPRQEWLPFLRKFKKADKVLVGEPEVEEIWSEKENYSAARTIVFETLEKYHSHMKRK